MPTIPNESATRKTHPFVFVCDRHPWCFFRIAVKRDTKFITRETAHDCPRPFDKRIGADIVASILSNLWTQLDEFYSRFKTLDGEEKTRAGYIMRGMAIAMTPFMNPYFKSADEIVREVVARADSKRLGLEHQTPGIGAFVAPPASTAVRAADLRPRATGHARGLVNPPAPQRTFTPEEMAAIKQAHAAGFDMKMLTTAYDCSEADIKSVLN